MKRKIRLPREVRKAIVIEFFSRLIRDSAEAGEAWDTEAAERAVRQVLIDSGLETVSLKKEYEEDIEKYLNVDPKEFLKRSYAQTALRNDADLALELAIKNEPQIIKRVFSARYAYSTIPDAIRISEKYVLIDEERTALDDIRYFLVFMEEVHVVRFSHNEDYNHWNVEVTGNLASELLEYINKNTLSYFKEKYRGKVINVNLKTAEVTTYDRSNLVYPSKLGRRIDDLVTNFKIWKDSGNEGKVKKWGAMLVGAPGMGKTTVAGLLASFKPPDCTILYSSASDFRGHRSTEKIKNFFFYARSLEPCLAIIDDVDEISGSRSLGVPTDTSTMLEYLDESQDTGKVFFLLTTNRPEVIDPAVKRSGRIHNIFVLEGYKECFVKLLQSYARIYELVLPNDLEWVLKEVQIPEDITPDETNNIMQRILLTKTDPNNDKVVSKEDLKRAISITIEDFHSDRENKGFLE